MIAPAHQPFAGLFADLFLSFCRCHFFKSMALVRLLVLMLLALSITSNVSPE